MKITININDSILEDLDLTTADVKRWAQSLVLDVFYEFTMARREADLSLEHAERYVNNHYSEDVYSGESRQDKIAQVHLRCRIARALRRGILTIEEG